MKKEKLILEKTKLLKEKIKIEEYVKNLDIKLKELEKNEEKNIFLKNVKENIDEVKEIRQLLYLYDKYEKNQHIVIMNVKYVPLMKFVNFLMNGKMDIH